MLVAALSWASSNMIVKLAGTDDLLRLIAWAHLIGIAPLLGLSYVFEGGPAAFTALTDITWVTIGELFFLGMIATCFGFMLWSYLLRRYPAYLVTPFSLVIPISGLISTALLLDESLGPQRLAGVGLVMIGLVLATLRFRRPPHRGPVAAGQPACLTTVMVRHAGQPDEEGRARRPAL